MEEINKKIHEIIGLGYYEGSVGKNIDFINSWAGYGLLWEWWQANLLIKKFLLEDCSGGYEIGALNEDEILIPIKYISPEKLAKATVDFFDNYEDFTGE